MFAIIAFALAVFALLVVAIALPICVMALTRRLSDLEATIAEIETTTRQSDATHLATELAVLDGDVKALAANLKRQMGRVWAELHHEGLLKRNSNSQSDLAPVPRVPNGVVDDDLAAMLALQAGPTVTPKEK